MYSYTAYGLGIKSLLSFPELFKSDSRIWDVQINTGKVKRSPEDSVATDYDLGLAYHCTNDRAYLFWKDMGTIFVKDGNEMIVDPDSGVDERVIRLHILGTAMAMLLRQRGYLVLHASAVVMEDGVVAFLGESGFGKSTLAAFLNAHGHCLVADDQLAIQFENGIPIVSPAFPRLKLWKDSAAFMGYPSESLPLIHPGYEKLGVDLKENFAQKALPLKQIYLLSEGQEQAIEPLESQQALIALLRHTHRIQLLPAVQKPAHFHQCADIANKVPVSRLRICYSFSEIPDLVRLVEEDLAASERIFSLA